MYSSMPAPVYSPGGSASARPVTMSISETSRQRPARLRREADQAQRHHRPRVSEVRVVGPQQLAQVDVPKRRRHLLVDDPRHLLRRHARRQQAGDERAGAGADVDVEVVDGAVDAQQVERAQRADLVDPACEAAATENERRLGATASPPLRPSGTFASAPGLPAGGPRVRLRRPSGIALYIRPLSLGIREP